MSERTGSKGTFYSLAKWFRWASLIIILAPVVLLVFGIIAAVKNYQTLPDWMLTGSSVLSIITLVAGVIWLILIIILFCTAGKVKDQINAFSTRIALLIALIFVFAPAIVSVLGAYNVITLEGTAATIVAILLPIIEVIGYIVAASTAGRAKRKLS